MNKVELVSHVAADTSTIGAAAERLISATFSAIADALARDQPVAIAGFGKLAVRGHAARQVRNPRTGEPVRRTDVEAAVVQAGEVVKRTVPAASIQRRLCNCMNLFQGYILLVLHALIFRISRV